ncbi:hypothetical protein C6P40_004079, partial [Pichia californica]
MNSSSSTTNESYPDNSDFNNGRNPHISKDKINVFSEEERNKSYNDYNNDNINDNMDLDNNDDRGHDHDVSLTIQNEINHSNTKLTNETNRIDNIIDQNEIDINRDNDHEMDDERRFNGTGMNEELVIQDEEEDDDDDLEDEDEDDEDEYDDELEDEMEEPSGAFANVGQGLIGKYKNFMMQYWQNTIDSIERDEHDFKNHQLPLARIKKVMKTDEEVNMISAEAPILFAKGCDIFITELTMRAWIHAEENKRRTLQKSDIAAALQKSDMFDFLIDIVPREEEKPKRKNPTGDPLINPSMESIQTNSNNNIINNNGNESNYSIVEISGNDVIGDDVVNDQGHHLQSDN